MAEEKSLHRMPVADCGDYAEIPPLSGCQRQLVGIRRNNRSRHSRDKKSPSLKDARGRLWVFEVGEHSEVGALEFSRNVNEVNRFREA